MLSTPLVEIERRIKTLQSAMAKNGLDAALIVQRVDLFYFTGSGQDAHLFLPVDGSPLLLVRRNLDRAFQESPLKSISAIKNYSHLKEAIESACSGPLGRMGMESWMCCLSTIIEFMRNSFLIRS